MSEGGRDGWREGGREGGSNNLKVICLRHNSMLFITPVSFRSGDLLILVCSMSLITL